MRSVERYLLDRRRSHVSTRSTYSQTPGERSVLHEHTNGSEREALPDDLTACSEARLDLLMTGCSTTRGRHQLLCQPPPDRGRSCSIALRYWKNTDDAAELTAVLGEGRGGGGGDHKRSPSSIAGRPAVKLTIGLEKQRSRQTIRIVDISFKYRWVVRQKQRAAAEPNPSREVLGRGRLTFAGVVEVGVMGWVDMYE